MDRWGYHCDRRLSVGTFIVFEWVSPTGDYLLSGLLRFALRALACKPGARRAWRARSPGQASTGRLAVSGSPTPVPRVPFFCVPKERNRKKGHPGLCARKSRGSPRSKLASVRPPQGQGRAGERRGSGESPPRRARAPRTVRTGLSSEAGNAGAKKGPSADPLRRLRREGQPAPFAGDGAGADGFGNFGRNQSSSSAGTRPG